ncbi:hypothetical protein Pfo_014013 [Paulownia fortunei]|nr:hypothetical protein Pfo_014013 [Paulownia fortunei]
MRPNFFVCYINNNLGKKIYLIRLSKMMASLSVAPITPPPPKSPTTPQRMAVPGSYGWPVIGPLSDRLQYFWFQGPSNFFKKRIEKYNSTVFRTNVPPAFPFFVGVNPNVVAVLDVKSFAHLFDMELVEKANVLVGDFMPSLSFTGGLRVCAYLDTSEPKHAQAKDFALDILKRSSSTWVSSMVTSLDTMWDSIDSQLSTSGTASYFFPLQQFLFTFLSRSILGADSSAVPEIKKSGHIMVDKWLGFQLLPTISINILQPLEEIFLHSFSYPFWLVKSDYKKLADFIENEAKETVERAQTEFKLTKEEAIHNLLFIFGFNAFGGFSIFLPTLLTNLGDQKSIHEELRKEVREKLADNVLSFETVKQMDLVNSVVYETLRLNPPVPSQFGRARKDFDLSSHNAVFEIKKGELLCGYQPVVMRDPKIFENPEDFVYDRFTKEKGGDQLLKYLYWSNGPQSGSQGPSASNKQCAANDTVPITAALFLAYLFQRYDEIAISSGSITALQKAK